MSKTSADNKEEATSGRPSKPKVINYTVAVKCFFKKFLSPFFDYKLLYVIHRRPTDAISRSIVGAVLAGNRNKCLSSLFIILPVTQAQLRTSHEQLAVPPVFHFAQLLIDDQRPHAVEWLTDRHDSLLAFVR